MVCGSPSSRLARQPMCPLDSAKMDSDWPRRSRSSLTSRTFHGSHVKWSFRITSIRHELREVVDHDVGAVPAKGFRLAYAIDADDEAKAAGAAGLDARERVFVDR